MPRKQAAGSTHKSQNIKIKAVRRKELDYDAIAFVLHTMAKRRVQERRKEGLPRPERTPEQLAELEKAFPEFAKLRKQNERLQAQLRKNGISPAGETLEPPEPGLAAEQAP